MVFHLEDEFSDVLSKAQKGLDLSTEDLARHSGLSEGAIRSARRGEFTESVVRALGRELGLNESALVELARGKWRPAAVPEMDGFLMIRSPFHDWEVNSFLVWDVTSKRAMAFDTGSTAEGMVEQLEVKGLTLDAVVLTHAHWDHFEGVPALKKRWPEARVFLGAKDSPVSFASEPVLEGFAYELGALRIRGFDTPGHTPGGMSFEVTGLPKPFAFVGDALFAASMGGARTSYRDALNSLERILSLPEDTVLAPGHGPLTTVAEERRHNCFAAG